MLPGLVGGRQRNAVINACLFAGLLALHVFVGSSHFAAPSAETLAVEPVTVSRVVIVSAAFVVLHMAACLLLSLAIIHVDRATFGRSIWLEPRAVATAVARVLQNESRSSVRLLMRICWCALYIVEAAFMWRASPQDQWDTTAMPEWLSTIQLGFGAIICSDIAFGFAAAERKSDYIFSGEAYTDAMLSPVVHLLIFSVTSDAEYTRSVTRFGYLRFLALLDLRAYSAALRGLDEVRLLLVQTLVRLTGVILLFAGFFFEAEAPDVARGFVGYFDFIYYMFITMSTVGYGDWSPTLWLTRAVAMVVILFVMTTVPAALSELAQLLASAKRRAGALPPPNEPHFVMIGDISPHQLDLLLRDLFGRFNGSATRHVAPRCVVLTSIELEAYDVETYARRYDGRVCLLRGDLLSTDVGLIERLALPSAIAIFVIATSERGSRAQRKADLRAALVVLALSKYSRAAVPRMFVQLNRDEHTRTLTDLGVRHILAQNSLKMTLLGKCAAGCSGLTTLVCALFLLDDAEADAPGRQGGGASTSSSEPWAKEHWRSWTFELYTAPVPAQLVGETFGAAAVALHDSSGGLVITLGCHPARAESADDILLNPSTRTLELSDELIVLAEGPECVEQLNAQPMDSLAIDRARARFNLPPRTTHRSDDSSGGLGQSSFKKLAASAGAAVGKRAQGLQRALRRSSEDDPRAIAIDPEGGGTSAGGKGGAASASGKDGASSSATPPHPTPPRPILGQLAPWTRETLLFGEEGARDGAYTSQLAQRRNTMVFSRAKPTSVSDVVVAHSIASALALEEDGALRAESDVCREDMRPLCRRTSGQLILICGWPGNLSSLVETAASLCAHRICVLAPGEPSDNCESLIALRKTARTHFVRGSPIDEHDLERAGLAYASCVVLFGGEDLSRAAGPAGSSDAGAAGGGAAENVGDSHVVLAVTKIRNVLQAVGRPPSTVQLLIDLDDVRSVRFVDDGREWWPVTDSFNAYLQSPAVASGMTYADELTVTMVTANFYMPHLISILNLLIGDERTAGVEQLPVPNLFGAISFGDLFSRMAVEGYIVLGLYCPMDKDEPKQGDTAEAPTSYWQRLRAIADADRRRHVCSEQHILQNMRTASHARIDAMSLGADAEKDVKEDKLPLFYVLINPQPSRLVGPKDRCARWRAGARESSDQRSIAERVCARSFQSCHR
jgi:hypothetical protein